jgi:hypothetical protein
MTDRASSLRHDSVGVSVCRSQTCLMVAETNDHIEHTQITHGADSGKVIDPNSDPSWSAPFIKRQRKV